jgi:hypothetical protein
MRWHHLGLGWDVLEIDYTPASSPTIEVAKREGELELVVFWGGGEPTRAMWRWAGRLAAWAEVGEA